MSLFRRIKRLSKGFSLVEMSVVLATVTAVVTMAAAGVSVIDKTKNNNIISDIEKYSTAIEKFESKYKALPGDIADVSALEGAAGSGGNGNGVIDNSREALNLWRHLSIAGLIEGTYNATEIPGKGLPAADIDGGGYKVKVSSAIQARTVSEQAITIELAGFSSTDSDLPIITAENAKSIDEKADDGNPETGIIIAEGNGTDCVTSDGKYNVSHLTASCRLIFIVRGSPVLSDAPLITGDCAELGLTRELGDSSQACPAGFVGKIIETCRVDENNVGSWDVTDRSCAEVKCSDGGSYGDTRRLSCINSMKGSGIVERCDENGLWVIESQDCSVKEHSPCSVNGEVREALGCPLGQTGYILQTCTDNKWVTTDNNCKDVQCDFKDVGVSENSGLSCGTNYTGTIPEVCTIDGEWQVTAVGSTCVPDYDGAGVCTAGVSSDKDLGCPLGKKGEHIVTCVDGKWTTLMDNCSPITCDGGENVGEYRVLTGAKCSNGSNGTVMEYCNSVGKWERSEKNCVTNICNATDDLAGNAYWPTTKAGDVAKSKNCNEGYEVSGNARRRCNLDGTWGNVIKSCQRAECPAGKYANSTATTDDDATYPATVAGENNISGTCDASKNYKGTPIADCSIDGDWGNERLACRKFCPTSTIANATYNEVFAGVTGVAGTCDAGYIGTPTMDCDSDGNWVNQVGACALETPPVILYCSASRINNADYPETEANTRRVAGVCKNGYEGSPTMDCDKDGNWGNERNACTSKIQHEKATIADMVMWFDAQDNDTVFRTGSCGGVARPGVDTVGCWKDKSGNSYHAKQSNVTLRPKYSSYAQGRNGYPVMQFNKDIIYYPYKSYTSDFSLFVMHKEDKFEYSGGYMTILGSNGDVERESVWLTFYKSPRDLMLYRGFDKTRHTFSYTYKKDVHNVSAVLYDNNKINYYRNGISEGGGNNIADNKDRHKLTQWGPGGIGGWNYGSGITEHYYGDVGEVVLYDKKLTVSEMRKVEEYLGDKWDIKIW